MFGKFFETIKVQKERLPGPREIQFENGVRLAISRSEADKEVHFKFFRDNAEIFDLKDKAPDGTKIYIDPEQEWSATVDKKEMFVGKYDEHDCILSFLHEAGHLQDELSKDLAWTARQKSAKEASKHKVNEYPQERLQAIKNEHDEVIRTERNAWAYALRQARQLEKQFGISILNKIGQGEVADVVKFINEFLDKYEKPYLQELYSIDIYTKEAMEKLFRELE